jgi:UDP-glucose 4-epimerase
VKRISGVDFDVRIGPRRPGDPAILVAKAERIRDKLGWTPAYADLATIVDQALRWERHLAGRKAA